MSRLATRRTLDSIVATLKDFEGDIADFRKTLETVNMGHLPKHLAKNEVAELEAWRALFLVIRMMAETVRDASPHDDDVKTAVEDLVNHILEYVLIEKTPPDELGDEWEYVTTSKRALRIRKQRIPPSTPTRG